MLNAVYIYSYAHGICLYIAYIVYIYNIKCVYFIIYIYIYVLYMNI